MTGRIPMDLRAAQQLNRRLDRVKIGALACFVLAGALLVASLLLQPLVKVGTSNGASPGITGSVR